MARASARSASGSPRRRRRPRRSPRAQPGRRRRAAAMARRSPSRDAPSRAAGEGRGVAGHHAGPRAAPAGRGRLLLHDEHRAALGGHEAAGRGGEGQVGPRRVLDGAQLVGSRAGRPSSTGAAAPRRRRRRRPVPRGCRGARARGRPAAGLVAGRRPPHGPEAAADGDLAGAGRVEPGDGLVRADEPGALPHSCCSSRWPNSPPPDRRRSPRPTANGHVVGGSQPGVVQREVGGGHARSGVNRSVWTRKRSSISASASKPRTSPATRSGRCPQPSRVIRSRTLTPCQGRPSRRRRRRPRWAR